MSAAVTLPHQPRLRSGAAIAVVALMAGLALGLVGGRFGPVAIVALPAAVIFLGWALQVPLLALALVPAAFPFGDAVIGGGFMPLAQAVAIAAIGVVVMGRLVRGLAPLPAPAAAWWMLLLVTALVLATPGAAAPALAYRQDVTIITGSLLALSVCAVCRTATAFRWLTALVLLAGAVVCTLGLVRSGTVSAQLDGAVVQGSIGIFTEHNQAGSVSAAILLLATAAGIAAPSLPLRLGAWLVAASALAQLGLSLSRGAYIGAFAGTAALMLLHTRARRRLLVTMLPLLVAGAGVALLAPVGGPVRIVGERIGSISSASSNPYDDRPVIWAEAIREFEQSPLVGNGPGSFPVVSLRSRSAAATVAAAHAHNVLLTVAAEDGAPAVLAVVGLTLAIGVAIFRTARRRSDDIALLAAGLGAALCSFIAQGMLDVTLRSSTIALLCWLLAGLALAASRLPPASSVDAGADGGTQGRGQEAAGA